MPAKKSPLILTFLSGVGLVAIVFLLFGYRPSSDAPGSTYDPEPYLPAIEGQEVAVLTDAPEVPPAITRDHATRVIVNLEVVEKVSELADGVQYKVWTFGGSVPGKFIRVREGDMVEFHLKNDPSNTFPHNIDLHAVTGTGGGAVASMVLPGKEATFQFRAIKSGLFVYHCATAPVGMHIANGMYGMILVQPKEGLPPVDHEYYVMQSEFYTKGHTYATGLQEFDMDKAIAETPEYVVFDGRIGALTGDHALKARAGETVRFFFGNAGPNLTSSFHVIGEMFDTVYQEGGSLPNQHNVQTTVVPPGGGTITQLKVDVPGKYTLVDHAIFRAFSKGALGILDVTGDDNPDIFAGQTNMADFAPQQGRTTE